MYKDIDFDENKPSKDNIEYVLSKILYCMVSSKCFEDYKEYEDKINKVLGELYKVIDTFVNTNDLLSIPFDVLDGIAVDIDYLDYKSVSKDGLYLEMASVWMPILIGYYQILQDDKNKYLLSIE